MDHAKIFLIFILAVWSLVSCRQPVEQQQEVTFFDLEAFLDEQVELISSLHPKLDKTTRVGDSIAQVTIRHDSSGWGREMSIFRTADIHKPGLRNYYRKEVRDSGDYAIESYELIDASQAETVYLHILRDRQDREIASIEALQKTENPIYRSRRKLFLSFKHLGEEDVGLDSFYVEGYQKMVMQDSVVYRSGGRIHYP